ncbi:MAG: SirB2 family protein [Halorhodospira sp.]
MHQLLLSSHILAALLSLGLLVARGLLMARGSGLLENRFLQLAPRAVDTVLLLTAIALMFLISQYPFVDGWVTVKLLGLVLYIVLGVIALGRARSLRTRVLALGGAILVIGYLYAYSVTREPLLIVGLGGLG